MNNNDDFNKNTKPSDDYVDQNPKNESDAEANAALVIFTIFATINISLIIIIILSLLF